jgi:hypothetical protein
VEGGRRPQRPVEALEADRNLRLPKELLILNGLQLQCHAMIGLSKLRLS